MYTFMAEQIIQVERMEEAVSLFGSYDSNIRLLEQEYDVKVLIRDTQIKVSGEQPGVMTAVKAINGLLHLIGSGEQLTDQNVRYVMTLVREGAEDTVRQLGGDSICVTTKGKPIKPKTLGQKKYVEAIQKNTVTLGIGPAGTGKTYLAVAMAVHAYKAKEIDRIILTRPAVEAANDWASCPATCRVK